MEWGLGEVASDGSAQGKETTPHVLDFLNKVLQNCMHVQIADVHAMRAI